MKAETKLPTTKSTQQNDQTPPSVPVSGRHRVVIVGGGFGGLYAALSLKGVDVDVTLIDKRNFHLFQPLLYQVATGSLSPGEIASPLRAVLNKQKHIRVIMGEVVDFDVDRRQVVLADGEIPYDSLLVALGATNHYFGNDWGEVAPGLKSVEDAIEIRKRIFLAFEAAERETDPEKRADWLRFVVTGGGPTGVELAGAVAEIANHTLEGDFRSIDPSEARVMLVEGIDRLLTAYPESLSHKAEKSLCKLGVEVRTGWMVTSIDKEGVTIKSGDDNEERIQTRTVLWGAGVRANPLGKKLADQTHAEINKGGQLTVERDLTLPGHPNIFVIGDMAKYVHDTGEPLPGIAPVAMQEGKFAASLIKKRAQAGDFELTVEKPFHYRDRGSLATIGRAAAVGTVWGFNVSGWFAWLTWLFVHLMYLVEFENRLLVLIQWAWNYITWNRGARLITGEVGKLDQAPNRPDTQ